jgi:hypothetical protein
MMTLLKGMKCGDKNTAIGCWRTEKRVSGVKSLFTFVEGYRLGSVKLGPRAEARLPAFFRSDPNAH